MSQHTPFGLSTVLDPPIFKDGKYYPLMLRFFSSADGGADQLESLDVCTAVIQYIIDDGDGYYTLVFQRAMRPSSVPKQDPSTGALLEWTYYSYCGGNVVNHPEPFRIYGWLSEVSVRGSLVGSLAERYDMVWGGVPEEGYFIAECKAFGYAPEDGVNFNPPETLAVNSRVNLDFPGEEITANGETFFDGLRFARPDLSTNKDAIIYFNDSESGFYDDCGLYQGSPLTKLDRQIFTTEENYPVDASLALGEYWIDPVSYQIVLSSNNITLGSTLIAQWWEKSLTELAYETPGKVALEGNGATGYHLEDDDLGGIYIPTKTDYENYFALVKTPTGYGTGAIQAQFGDEKIVLFWTNDFITGVSVRPRTTLELGAVSFTANSIGFTDDIVFIWFRKTLNVISVYHQEMSSPVKTLIAEITLGANIGYNTWGTFGATVWSTNKIKLIPQVIGTYARFAGDFILSKQITKTWTDLIYSKEYSLPTFAAITSVSGTRYGAYSGVGDARRRNHYEDLGSGRVKFYSETAPDIVTFVQEPTPGPPALTRGRCPRANGSLNLATIADPETLEPTSDVNQNIWNWHDTVKIYSPGPMNLLVGDTVHIRRNAVLDPRQPYTLGATRKDGPDPEFTVIAVEDRISRPAEGIFLIEQSRAEVIGIQNLCARLHGTFVRHHGRKNARVPNELGEAIEAFSELYFTTTTSGSGETHYSGTVENKRIVDADRSCELIPGTSSWTIQTNDLMLGITKDNWSDGDYSLGIGDRLYWAGLVLPQWITFGQQLSETGSGAEEFHNGNDVTHVCPDGSHNWRDFELGTANRPVWAAIYGTNYFYAGENGFGVTPPNPVSGALFPQQAAFNFQGIPFGLPAEFKRTFRGARVKKAWLRAKFNGLKHWAWSIETDSSWPRNSAALLAGRSSGNERILEIVNGTTVLDYEKVNGVITKPYAPSYDKEALAQTSAEMSFQLVGQKRSSKNIFYDFNFNDIFLYARVFGNPMPSEAEVDAQRLYYTDTIAEGGWQSFSTGITSGGPVQSGKWCKVDCREALQALLSYGRDSKCVNFQLWPAQVGISVNAGISDLASFAQSIDWAGTIETSELDFDLLSFQFRAHGQLTTWDNFQLGSIEVQLEMPNGAVRDVVLGPPINRPPMIGEAP